MKIGVDVEGVLADSHVVWVRDYNELHRTSLKVDDITDWYFEGTKFEVSSNDFVLQVAELWRDRWKEIPPTEIDLSRKLQALNEKHEVIVITSRKINENEIQNWLGLHGIKYSEFVALDYSPSSSRKTSIPCDVYVDDNPLLALEIQGESMLMLYDRPWNRKTNENQYVRRVIDFDQISRLLG